MTVKELIEQLQQQAPDHVVHVLDGFGNCDGLLRVVHGEDDGSNVFLVCDN